MSTTDEPTTASAVAVVMSLVAAVAGGAVGEGGTFELTQVSLTAQRLFTRHAPTMQRAAQQQVDMLLVQA
jgi:hypothetical protein